jgi:hypothetical protein
VTGLKKGFEEGMRDEGFEEGMRESEGMRGESNQCGGSSTRHSAAVLCIPFVLLIPFSSLIPHPSSLFSNPSSLLRPSQDVPAVGQPTAHFYNAHGRGVSVKWELDRTELPEDEELIATLVITRAINPHEIIRPDLKTLESFHSRFEITDNADPVPAADAQIVRFSYRLRPRNRLVDQLPTFKFHYFNQAAVPEKQFPLTTARGVPIVVTAPAPKPPPPVIPLAAPDHLFMVTTGPRVLARPSFAPGIGTWITAILIGPLVSLGWYYARRWIYPDAARLKHIRRSWASRRAIHAIRRSGRTVDPPAAVAIAMIDYLRARYSLPPGAVTPREIDANLAEIELRDSEREAVASFFRSCDAARFAPAGDSGVSLAAAAEALVARLEAA